MSNLQVALEAGDTLLVKDVLNQWEKAEPDDPDMLFYKSRILYNLGEISIDSALVTLGEITRLAPKRADYALAFIEQTTLRNFNVDEAVRKIMDFDSRVKADPEGWTFDTNEVAPEDFDKLTAQLAGDLVEELGRDGALSDAEAFVDALAGTSLDTQATLEARKALAMSFSMHKQYEKAIETVKKLLADGATNRDALLFNIALYYSYLDNTEEALKYARMAQEAGDTVKAPRLIEDLMTPPDEARYYDFVFQLLPRLLSQLPVSEHVAEILSSPEEVVTIFKQNRIIISKDLSGIKSEVVPSEVGNVIVWTMPEPEEMTEPKYIAFVPGSEHYSLLTLEKTFDFEGNFKGDAYIAGGANFNAGDRMASHFSFGEYVDGKTCTPEQFVKLIGSHLKK
ncbi:MAG: hypothetical protein K2K84_07005 [Muribaculaceae bacterium]|nr:hypothetical protein [Muribaculaceae bacterium]